jgi:hypothetical protein
MVMIDTDETGLPKNENVVNEENVNGKPVETHAPVNEPDDKTSTTDVKVDITTNEPSINEKEDVVSSQAKEEKPSSLEHEDATSDIDEKDVPSDEKDIDENLKEAPKEKKKESFTSALASLTKSELIELLKQVVADPIKYVRAEGDLLKQAFYKLRRTELEAHKKIFIENGGEEKDFVTDEDELESQLKDLLSELKSKRTEIAAEEERQKEANYLLKQHLIERLKEITESQDDFNKLYNEFREIQLKWKEIKFVPQEHVKELWRNYQLYNERFYDLIKINNQFRDYDFKKNLELKTALCETVERLEEETDVVSAFHQLQKLHQQWRDIGPVAKEFRDSIWDRFKAASTVINKRHQAYFEFLKTEEEQNLEQKTAICVEIESVDFDSLKTMREWEKKTSEVLALQSKWRTIGFATKKQNVKIFERFRATCDNYFNKKSEFYKSAKKEMDKNLELKTALVEKAEAMKESEDWKESIKAFVQIQNEWKKIGPISKKYSEPLWKQFIGACDYFFERKNKAFYSHKSEENENFEAKKALIEKIKSIDESIEEPEALTLLHGYISDWNNIGFVPFKEKDKIYKIFRDEVNKQFDRLKVSERDRRLQQYRSNLSEIAESGKNKLYNERDRLLRTYERLKNELQTYENNIGFLNISSKGGGGIVKEMDRKIERLKEEMEVIVKKIDAIDENLET